MVKKLNRASFRLLQFGSKIVVALFLANLWLYVAFVLEKVIFDRMDSVLAIEHFGRLKYLTQVSAPVPQEVQQIGVNDFESRVDVLAILVSVSLFQIFFVADISKRLQQCSQNFP